MTLHAADRGRTWELVSGRVVMLKEPRPGAQSPEAASRRARAGAAAEDWLDELHAVCAARGVAWIDKRATNSRVVGRGDATRVIHTAKSGVDYFGVLRSGRAIFIEAKSTAQPRRRFSVSDVKPHQRAYLDARMTRAVCLLVVVVQDVGRPRAVCPIPWATARAVLERGGTWSPDELARSFGRDGQRPYLEAWADA